MVINEYAVTTIDGNNVPINQYNNPHNKPKDDVVADILRRIILFIRSSSFRSEKENHFDQFIICII